MTVSGSCLSRTPRRNDPLDEEVLPEDQIAADRATEEPRQDLRARIRLRPAPGVADHEGREAVGVASSDREADRPAPVLDHHGHVPQIELEQQLLEDAGVLGGGVAVAW